MLPVGDISGPGLIVVRQHFHNAEHVCLEGEYAQARQVNEVSEAIMVGLGCCRI